VKTRSKQQFTAQLQSPSQGQPGSNQIMKSGVRRRSFIKGLGLAGAALFPASTLLINNAGAQVMPNDDDDSGGALTPGDASLLRFVALAEIIESDFWEQYWELGGTQLSDFAAPNPATGTFPTPTGGNGPYTTALQILDGDMPQYILDNTDDEFAHANFLLAYLKSKGANTSDLDALLTTQFRTLSGSMATGSTKKGRLTNLTQLTIDTSFWGLYRTDNANPDLGGTTFAQAVPSLNMGKHTAIPRTDMDTMHPNLIKAIAFTAGFHFPFIEIHGTSLYPSLAQRATDPEVLRILLSIGPTEAMHFQTWQDKAGNATPVSVFDTINGSSVTFHDLTKSTKEHLQANLIMPEPCPFLSTGLPLCSIVRPTATAGAAMGAVQTLTANGLFIGQSNDFFQLLQDLATDADAAPSPG
jgi:hypothetical protein